MPLYVLFTLNLNWIAIVSIGRSVYRTGKVSCSEEYSNFWNCMKIRLANPDKAEVPTRSVTDFYSTETFSRKTKRTITKSIYRFSSNLEHKKRTSKRDEFFCTKRRKYIITIITH
jgi:hypothetical protein